VGLLVQQGATVLCAHGGQASPTATAPRVTLSDRSAVTQPPPWTVSGCPLPTNAGGPCVTATWTSGTRRVRTQGQSLVVQDGGATCTPTGVPLTVTVTQTRVRAT
jgi:hypothetical protein